MANFKSAFASGQRNVPVAGGSDVLSLRAAIAVTTALASADILEAFELPEDHVPVDFMVDADDIDSGATPAVTLSAGLLNAGKTDLSTAADDGGAVWLADSTVGQAGGLVRPTTKAVTRVAPKATTRRMIGLKVTTAAVTPVAGTVGITVHYRAAYQNQ